MKVDSDVIRLSPSMRNQIEAYASLKGEQVIFLIMHLLSILRSVPFSQCLIYAGCCKSYCREC